MSIDSKVITSLGEEEVEVGEPLVCEGGDDDNGNNGTEIIGDIASTSTISSEYLGSRKFIAGSSDMIPKHFLRPEYNIYIAVCSANIAAIASGCALAWSSPTLPKIQEPGEKIYVTKEEGAWLSSLIALGAAFGPFVASAVVNTIGRKITLLVDMVLFLTSWAIIGISDHITYMYVARFLVGLAVGCVFTILPMYVAEVSPVHLRGALGSLLQFFLCLGFIITYCIGPYTSFSVLVIVSAFVPLFCIMLFIWVPESPCHLISKGKKQQASDALQWLRGYPEKSVIQDEIGELQVAAEESSKMEGSIFSLFSSKGNLKTLYYSCSLVMLQQMSGINIVLFYSESIFQATGSSLSPSISTIIVGLVMFSTAALCAPAAKIVGVKNLLVLSAIGDGITTGALGVYFFLQQNGEDIVSALGWLPVTSLVIFIITYSIGLGPFPWVIMAEIFPSHLKATASAVTASFCWTLCFLLTRYFSAFVEIIGISYAFWLFSVFCIVLLFFILFQLPDTQGKTFNEIQEMIHGKKAQVTELKV